MTQAPPPNPEPAPGTVVPQGDPEGPYQPVPDDPMQNPHEEGADEERREGNLYDGGEIPRVSEGDDESFEAGE